MKKILYLITEDWFFCSHFIDRAIAAKEAGYEIIVVARENLSGNKIRSAGIRLLPVNFDRRSTNIFQELKTLISILKIYAHEKPDIVHQIASKPILYGSLLAIFTRKPAIINAPVGMGYVFSSKDSIARILKPIISIGYSLLLNPRRSKVIFENSDDLNNAIKINAVKATDAVLIRGAGVNINHLKPTIKSTRVPIVVLVARMLRDKGIVEFFKAARLLETQGVHARFVLVGDPDPGNPASVSEEQLRSWNGKHGIEWWGWRENIDEVLHQANIACLPSYREGLPKSLLEAAACGLPIVTTDTVGCREVVTNGVNGFLVQPRDFEGLASALKILIENPILQIQMGKCSRKLAEIEFSSEKIIKETLAVYHKLAPI